MTSSKILRAARALPIAATLAVGGLASSPVVIPQRAMAEGPASVADLAERLAGAVVNISTSRSAGNTGSGKVPMPKLPEGSPLQEFFDDFFQEQPDQDHEPQQAQSLGSGFVIDAKEGIVVTNNHVISGADEIVVNFSDGGKLDAELLGVDTKTDIAVLKIDPSKRELAAVPFGNSDKMRIGDWVMAIGNPFGLGGTVTVGIISARNREIGSGPYDDFIQTDAAINRGNSGGPLFNMDGEVIGINTAIISPTGGSIGIGFSIPSSLAVNVVDQLREFGETRRGWLGVRIQEVTDDIAESLGMKKAVGAMVSGVIEGGPVDDGTIQPGDVVTRFDGKEIVHMRDLPRIVAESPVGEEVDVVLIRKGEEKTVRVKLGRLEDSEKLASAEEGQDNKSGDDAAPVSTAAVLGMHMAQLDDATRETFEISNDVSGVVVSEVDEGSVAAEKGVSAGDVIVEIAQATVSSPKDVLDRLEELKGQGRRNALLMLASKNGELRFVTLRMD
ncbi:serine protease [Nitratireductor indicus C115]|uniref:Probable periplasmic serine endoprotease DegP-like n=1 Tax=Nitratireductor indicus C115 TaxID=1231190 RepID=K2N7A2_9HYPH|nr:DegQ family serine endoprotease [Nitratireductor indicus]EKF43358.1 serine protease [Nitratireductor indicus C115]SFQ09238.1 serine protease Do [Nitratireductor indicus]